jgi:glutathione S-transferase
MKMKPDLAFGQVPALEVKKDGKTSWLFQSASILRFLAKISGKNSLYPKDPVVAARVDMICDQEADAFQGFRVARYKDRFGFSSKTVLTPDVEKTVKATINRDIIPRHLGYMERLLKDGATGFLAGTKEPTIADFFWYPTFVAIANGWTEDANILKSFPFIQKFMSKFKAFDDALRKSS